MQSNINSIEYGRGQSKGYKIIVKNGDKLRGTIVSQQQYNASKNKMKSIKVEQPMIPFKDYQAIDVLGE